jgi:hypothetical protein
VKRD